MFKKKKPLVDPKAEEDMIKWFNSNQKTASEHKDTSRSSILQFSTADSLAGSERQYLTKIQTSKPVLDQSEVDAFLQNENHFGKKSDLTDQTCEDDFFANPFGGPATGPQTKKAKQKASVHAIPSRILDEDDPNFDDSIKETDELAKFLVLEEPSKKRVSMPASSSCDILGKVESDKEKEEESDNKLLSSIESIRSADLRDANSPLSLDLKYDEVSRSSISEYFNINDSLDQDVAELDLQDIDSFIQKSKATNSPQKERLTFLDDD